MYLLTGGLVCMEILNLLSGSGSDWYPANPGDGGKGLSGRPASVCRLKFGDICVPCDILAGAGIGVYCVACDDRCGGVHWIA
jgi:hypothetical protein